MNPVHLPTGQQPGNQPVPERSQPSPATSTIPGAPLYQNTQRSSPKEVASSSAGRRKDAARDGGDKLGQSEIQDIMSQKNEAEHLQRNVAKGHDGRVPKNFEPSAPRGPTRSASGASRSSTIGVSGIVPPDESEDSN